MSTPSNNLETRVSTLETLIGINSSSSPSSVSNSSVEIEGLQQKIKQLEKQLNRANYRIEHLVRAYDNQRKALEQKQ
jgi:hypothetical protein